MSTKIPAVETYRGVRIHDCQSARRIEAVVKPAIDHVFGLSDLQQLFGYAGSTENPPEGRLLAAAKCEASYRMAIDERRERPDIDLGKVRAAVAGLDTIRWRSRTHFCSILDTRRPPGTLGPVQRETQLSEGH